MEDDRMIHWLSPLCDKLNLHKGMGDNRRGPVVTIIVDGLCGAFRFGSIYSFQIEWSAVKALSDS